METIDGLPIPINEDEDLLLEGEEEHHKISLNERIPYQKIHLIFVGIICKSIDIDASIKYWSLVNYLHMVCVYMDFKKIPTILSNQLYYSSFIIASALSPFLSI